MATLSDLLGGLQPIVNTADASTLIRDPEGVALRYAPTGLTYRPSPAIERWAERITSELAGRIPVTGYVVGDFGYGKTSAGLHLVRRCEAGGFVCVPPATYDRLDQVAEAVHVCARRAIEARLPSVAADLSTARAALPANPGASDVVQFAATCTRLVRQAGYAGLLVVIDELQHFINRDEAVATRIQALSRMVQGIRDLAPVAAAGGRPAAPGTPLGLIVLMPASPTEAILREQADDMMQRMEERETSLRLADAYGEAFVRDVWAQACEQLDDPVIGRRGVEDATFVSLGQLVARRDLSNGPRTMVQAFKQIAARLESGGASYTALDLARDYRAGHLVFDGPSQRIRSAMATLLQRPEVRGNEAYERATLLMAVFPDGLTQAIADATDVAAGEGSLEGGVSTFQAVLDLNEAPNLWIGLVTYLVRDGAYGLVALQPDARPADVLTTLVREFSVRYLNWDAGARARYAEHGFLAHVMPHLFDTKTSGRDAAADWQSDSRGVAFRVIEGAPGQLGREFPDRRLCLAVGTTPDDVRAFRPAPGTLAHMVWRLALVPASVMDGVGAPAPLVIEGTRADPFVDLRIPLGQTLGPSLPPDLSLLKNRVAPERTNVQMLLALIHFADVARGANVAMGEADRQEHDQLIRSLTREVARLLLPEATDAARVQVRGIQVGRGHLAGSDRALLESLFATKCRELFPEYRALAGVTQWRQQILHYLTGLRQCNLASRRGHEKVERAKKSELAALFSMRNVAFDNFRTFCKDRGLLASESRDIPSTVRGQDPGSELIFTLCPAERRAVQVLERKGRPLPLEGARTSRTVLALEHSVIRDELWKDGYLADEVEEAIKLLEARQLVRRGDDGTVQQHPGDMTAEDVLTRLATFEGRVRGLRLVLGPDRVATLTDAAGSTRQRLADHRDDISVDRADHELKDSIAGLDTAVRLAWDERQAELRTARTGVTQARRRLRLDEAERAIVGAITIVVPIDETRRRLATRVRACDQTLLALDARAARLLELAGPTDPGAIELATGSADVRRQLAAETERADRLGTLVETLTNWRRIVADASTLAPEPATPEATEFDRVICAPILDHLAGRDPDGLANYEHYANLVNERIRERDRIAGEKRSAFERERDSYQSRIRSVVPEYSLRTPFDPANADASYAALRIEAIEKVRPRIAELEGMVSALRNDLLFLQSERRIDVSEALPHVETASRSVADAEQSLGEAISAEAIGEVVALVVRARDDEFGPARTRYEQLRTDVATPDPAEERVLEVLRAAQPAQSTAPVSIERVRRANAQNETLEALLAKVAALYRKGHVDIQVRLKQ
jgi:hypothetical protein